MPISPDLLPDDIAALKALLLAREGEMEKLRATVSTLEQALSVRGLEIDQLKLQLAKLKRMQFGRKSEKLDRKIEQLETRLEDLVAEEGAGEQQAAPAARPRKSERQPLPEHLANFSGVLQADAYAGYDQVYADARVREAACMAHARRKIHDLHVRRATVTTTEALRRIGELYAIEEQIRGQSPDERRRIRQEQARPLLGDFEQWLRNRLLTLSTQSDTTKAINYMLNQWRALVYYCDDGMAEIDNNIAENALGGVALGRKNFMFLGADSGGERAAAMYSLIVSAKLNGVDPQAYLRHVLTQIADYPINKVSDLLPWNLVSQLTRLPI